MKSKGTLNESEAAELIADVEAYQKENERLKELEQITSRLAENRKEQIDILRQQLKQYIEALETISEETDDQVARGCADEALSLIREEAGGSHDT
jgi:flagellar hook-associated protein FlgK